MSNECPGMSSKKAGSTTACSGCPNQTTCQTKQEDEAVDIIKENLINKLKIAVMSGKGGVGKSTISRALASFYSRTKTTCLVDLDLTGPSIPILCNNYSAGVFVESEQPNLYSFVPKDTIRGSFLENDFSIFDVLIFDTPPNITESHLSIAKYLKLDGVIIVTQPHFLSFNDCRRMLDFCKKAEFNVLGIIVNMNGFLCECGHFNESEEDGKLFCQREDVNYLGSITLNREIARNSDIGNTLDDFYTDIFSKILTPINK